MALCLDASRTAYHQNETDPSCQSLRSLPFSRPSGLTPPEWNDLELSILGLEDVLDLDTISLQHDLLALVVSGAVELPSEAAEETFECLFGNVVGADDFFLDSLLECVNHKPDGVRLGEDTRGDLVTALADGRVRGTVRTQEELGIARDGRPQQRVPIRGCLGHGLAEAVRVAGPVVNDQGQVVGGDCGRNRGTACLDRLGRRGGGAVLEDDPQLGETLVQVLELGQEGLFGGQDGDVVCCRTGDFAVEVQDHVLALHLGEDGVEGLVAYDAGAGVCGYSGWVGFDTRDACGDSLLDNLWGDGFVEV